MVLVDADHVTVCCVTCWIDMRIIPVTFECADVSLHNRAFYFVRSSHSTIARSKNERSCTSTPSYASQIYRLFHDVLRITKNYYRKTVGHVITKPVQIEGTTKKFFLNKLFFIVVHISSAGRCECMQ